MEILFLMCGYCSVDVFRRFYGQVNILMAAAEMCGAIYYVVSVLDR